MNIQKEIMEIIKDILAIQDVRLWHNLEYDLGVNELDKIEIIMALEELYDIEIDDNNIDKMKTVLDTILLVVNPIENPEYFL